LIVLIFIACYTKLFGINFFCCAVFKELVGSNGIEPSTSRLSGVRSNQLSYEPIYGGDKEIRTLDPLLARQVLSQLSYTPISIIALV
jgi:hypothetical protein